MDYSWINEYCLEKNGTETDFKEEWNATRYMIQGKMFAMQGQDNKGNSIFTLKLEPDFGELLRKQYPDFITPGYYMNKLHWNSLYLDGDVPQNVVKDMIDQAYSLILHSFSKKIQKEILENP